MVTKQIIITLIKLWITDKFYLYKLLKRSQRLSTTIHNNDLKRFLKIFVALFRRIKNF